MRLHTSLHVPCAPSYALGQNSKVQFACIVHTNAPCERTTICRDAESALQFPGGLEGERGNPRVRRPAGLHLWQVHRTARDCSTVLTLAL